MQHRPNAGRLSPRAGKVDVGVADVMNRPWLEQYDEGVPPSLEYPHGTLVDVLRATAAERPAHPAVLFKGTTLWYGNLDRLSTAFAATLAAEGVRKGDRVALLLPNCPQFLIAQFGIWKAGGVVVALNPIYTEPELELPLRETGAEVLVALTRLYARAKAVQPRTRVRRIIATNIKEYLPPIVALLFTLLREKKEGHRITLAPGDAWFRRQLAAGAGKPRSGRHRVGQRPGRHPRERRHDRNAEGRCRCAPRLCAGRTAAAPMDRGPLRTVGRPHHVAAASLPRVRQRRRAGHGADGPQPARARAEPARHRRCACDDSEGAAGILHRCPDPLHRSAQPSRRAGGPCGLQLHPGLLLGRVGADGGNARGGSRS